MLKPEDLDKLRELFEIDGNVIHEAFQDAMGYMEQFDTQNHPRQLPGTVFWGCFVKFMADAVTYDEETVWVSKTTQGKPYLINDHLKKVIFYASGNEATGTSDDTKLKRIGAVTKRMIAVNENKIQKSLFPIEDNQDLGTLMNSWKLRGYEIWTLIYHLDKKNKTVQCEISKPFLNGLPNDCLLAPRHKLPIFTYSEPVEVTDDQEVAALSTTTPDFSTTEMLDTGVEVTKKESSSSKTAEEKDNK